MKRYLGEVIILIIQLSMLYLFPVLVGSTYAIDMILLIILSTFILYIVLGVISNKKIKYLYPTIIAILYIPSVFIYYNDSALPYSSWHFVVSIVGIIIGIIIRGIVNKLNRKK